MIHPDKNQPAGANTSGDSTVQEGKGVEKVEKKRYDKSEEQQEFIEEINIITEVSDEPQQRTEQV